MVYTPPLGHDHDEFVFADTYLDSINVYKKIISNLGDM